MEIMNYLLPSLLSSAITILVIWLFLYFEAKKRNAEILKNTNETTIPIRLQAYERVILFLERISPENLIIRVHQPGMSAFHFRAALINSIREEYEHNLSQQLYLSSRSWEMVKNAKEEIIKMINTSASKLSEDELATGEELSSDIFETALQMQRISTLKAIEELKKEIRKVFVY